MDPHQMHNQMGSGGMNPTQQQALLQQQQQQYNQLFAQQQFINLPQFYGGQQMLGMDPYQQMQQQQLLQAMQQQQQQQQQQQTQQQVHPQHQAHQQMAMHQQIPTQQNQMFQQHQLLQQQQQQQTQQQRYVQQQAAVVQQQQAQTQQQRLLEEQQRQMEILRQQKMQQELAIREQQMKEQKEREAEELARRRAAEQQRLKEEAARRAQIEAQMREQQRLQEEAQRKAEEERLKQEAERKEREKLIRVQEEQRARAREAAELAAEVQKRVQAVPGPVTLLGCPMIKLTTMLPFPCENMSASKLPRVSDPSTMAGILNNYDAALVQEIVNSLAQCDVNEVKLRQDTETNDLPVDDMPPLIKAVLAIDVKALDVEPEHTIEEQQLLNVLHSELDVVGNVINAHDDHVHHPCSSRVHEAPAKTSPKPYIPLEPVTHPDRDQSTLRKQMVSVGKQPKAPQGGNNQGRKKRDMVESLFDSLTDYFDPSEGRRARRKAKTFEEELADKRDLEMVAAASSSEHMEVDESDHNENDTDHIPDQAGPSGGSDGEQESGKFFEKKKGKKRKLDDPERPPTPTEVIEKRDQEWKDRQRKRLEKQRRRQRGDDSDHEDWNHDVMAEQNSLETLENTIEEILEGVDIELISQQINNEDEDTDINEIDKELLIENNKMEILRSEAQKLKEWKKLYKVNEDRLIKLLTILERNIRDVISQEGQMPLATMLDDECVDDDDVAARELIDERLLRAADAACTAMIVMTSTKMPKKVFVEDAIDRSIQLCKQYLQHIVFPASDSVFRSPNKQKKVEEKSRGRRKPGTSSRSPTIQKLYLRMADLVGCFAELVRVQVLPEMSVHQLSSIATSSFFVNNIGEVQWQAMRLLSNIFNKHGDQMRHNIITDIVNALHRLPSAKTTSNSMRLSSGMWLNNVTVLIMQLVQSTIEMPKRKKKDQEDENADATNEFERSDRLVKESFESANRMASVFLGGFLQKCASKGEEDYRRLFESFLQDLLSALHKPEWPAAEFLLSILGHMLVKHYRSTKGTDIGLRTASLEYLGMITAKLKKDVRIAEEEAERRLEVVVKTLIYEEMDDPPATVTDVDITHMSITDRLKKLEQSLIDYLLLSKDGDVSVEYAVQFYAGYWYKETAEDLDNLKREYKQKRKRAERDGMADKDIKKQERRLEKFNEKAERMKEYLIKLVDKKHMRKRIENIRRENLNVMMESDAAWTVKYLASRRELTQSGFENYLKQILFGVIQETTVSLRTRAMKCLTQVIEADQSVLGMPEVQKAVQARMVDANAQVREATIELIGKYLINVPAFIPKYYPILLERIKDSGTAVRKRVIRIMRELTERNPNFEKIPEMLGKIVMRIDDEDGVKKLVIETIQLLWFHPTKESEHPSLVKKVKTMTAVTEHCAVAKLELLLSQILKTADKPVIYATSQIVDCLVDNVLALESKMVAENSVPSNATNGAEENGGLEAAAKHKVNQDKMLACLTTLSLFSKVRPEMLVKHAETLQPYLSMTATTQPEIQVLNQVILMLERVIPLMSHPSETFISSMEESLAGLIVIGQVLIVQSAVACSAAVHERFPRKKPSIASKFLAFLGLLNQIRNQPMQPTDQKKITLLQRAIFSVGLLCHHFDFDSILEGDQTALKYYTPVSLPKDILADAGIPVPEYEGPRAIRDNVFVLLEHFSRYTLPAVRLRALTSIGHLCAQYAEYLTRPEIKNMYMTLLRSNEEQYLEPKILVLRNLELFLLNEEKKMMKHNEEWQKKKETEDLKEMDQAGSGLGSAIIQVYWNYVLNCYFNRNDRVREAAVQVTWLTLNQGLVTPGSSIPTLIAMMTDALPSIRNKVENMLKEIDTKYAGMVQSKAVAGIRWAFKLQSQIREPRTQIMRGIRAVEGSATANTAGRRIALDENDIPRYSNDGQAILSGLYQSLRTNRQQRRSFLGAMLRLFSEDSRDKLSLEEWIFVADNIAMFPYQVMDEPLYVIRQIDGIVSLSGESIINQFKAQLLPKSGASALQVQDDDLDFEPEAIYRRLPDEKTHLYDLMNNSQACFILLYLKAFLMKLYGFTENKVQEYSPSEAAKVYEKAVGRKNCHMFNPSTAIEELKTERIAERNTLNGHIALSNQICNFRKMLLSLDRTEEDDEDDVPTETAQREESDGEETERDPKQDGETTEMDESDAQSEAAHI